LWFFYLLWNFVSEIYKVGISTKCEKIILIFVVLSCDCSCKTETSLPVVRKITRINSMNTYIFLTKLGMYKWSILNIFDLEKKRYMATDKTQLAVPATKLTIWLETITEKVLSWYKTRIMTGHPHEWWLRMFFSFFRKRVW
jgi:hypothetical protein